MRITLDETQYSTAVTAARLEDERAALLWAELVRSAGGTQRSRVRDVAWYGGGLVTVLACAYFLGSSWGSQGPEVGLAIAAVYAVGALLGAEVLRARALPVPAALLGLVVVALVPVAVAALEDLTTWVTSAQGAEGVAAWLREDATLTALGALGVGSLVLARYRRAFLLVPLVAALSYAVASLGDATGSAVALVSLLVAGLLVAGALLDARGREDEGFWLQLGGLLMVEHLLWDVLEVSEGTGALVHGVAGVAAVAWAVRSGRRLYLAAGAIGVFLALSHLAFEVFADSLLFPLALAVLGIGVVLSGVRLDAATSR